PLLHQQSGHGREAVRQSRSESLEYRKLLPLGSRYDLSRGRVADPRKGAEGELCLAQSLHLVAPEAASRGPEHRHETSLLWLERKLHAGSPYRGNGLVSAGPVHRCRQRHDPALELRDQVLLVAATVGQEHNLVGRSGAV